MKSSEHYANLLFSPEDRENIKLHEHSSEKRVNTIRFGKEESAVSIPCVSWNIGDGQTDRKQIVLKEVLEGYSRSLLLLQECTWKPHDAGMRRFQSGCRFISSNFRGFTNLTSNHRAIYSKDSCNRYLSIIFDSTVFHDVEVPEEAFDLRDRLVSVVGTRSHICLALLREKSTGRSFFVVNVHARRGDTVFTEEAVKFISQLYELYDPRGSRFVSGVIWAGDFNVNLIEVPFLPRNFVILMTDDDETRPNRPLDFIGYVNGPPSGATPSHRSKIIMGNGTLKNWVYDALELYTLESIPRVRTVYQSQKKKKSKKTNTREEKHEVLNHPIILASVSFEFYEHDIHIVAENL